MRYRIFSVPIQDPGDAEAELNAFLDSHRVLDVERELVVDGRHSLWCFCVCYTEGAPPSAGKARGKGAIDYREVLSAADFAVYARLRQVRKVLAERDGVPAYAVFTNEQLAEAVRRAPGSAAELAAIEGVGQARVEKYGAALLDALRRTRDEAGDAPHGD